MTKGIWALAVVLVAAGMWAWARWGMAVALGTPAWLCQ